MDLNQSLLTIAFPGLLTFFLVFFYQKLNSKGVLRSPDILTLFLRMNQDYIVGYIMWSNLLTNGEEMFYVVILKYISRCLPLLNAYHPELYGFHKTKKLSGICSKSMLLLFNYKYQHLFVF